MFNRDAELPYDLRIKDFEIAIQDVYDFFRDVNELLIGKGLPRLDDMLRPAAMSGIPIGYVDREFGESFPFPC